MSSVICEHPKLASILNSYKIANAHFQKQLVSTDRSPPDVLLTWPVSQRERLFYAMSTTNVFALLDDENEDPQQLAANMKSSPKPAAAIADAKTGRLALKGLAPHVPCCDFKRAQLAVRAPASRSGQRRWRTCCQRCWP